MTEEHTSLVQARLSAQHARQVDQDMATLGLRTRSDAVRAGLRLLHRQARQEALAREYDEFYGGQPAPLTDTTAIGDQLAAHVMSAERDDA